VWLGVEGSEETERGSMTMDRQIRAWLTVSSVIFARVQAPPSSKVGGRPSQTEQICSITVEAPFGEAQRASASVFVDLSISDAF